MVVMVINKFAHRITNAGVVESAPIREFGLPTDKEKEIIIPDEGWESRTPASMNLTGGDFSLIETELQRFSYVFSDKDYVLPSSEAQPPAQVEATAPR